MSQKETIYQFSINSLQGNKIDFSAFEGKVLLLVNTASKCGFTPQYEGLEKLNEKYKDKGLVIIGFPCNQFGKQEPGSAQEIQDSCLVNYGVSFAITEKIDVNGENTHPIYIFLKDQCRGFLTKNIKWNFTKFVVDKKGKPVKRFGSIVTPEKMESYLVKLLENK